jgi:galactosylceramidase
MSRLLKQRHTHLTRLIALVFLPLAAHAIGVGDLRCEGASLPSGLTNPQPKFSWVFTGDDTSPKQGGYRITMASAPEKLEHPDIWDSGPTSTDRSEEIGYSGEPLKPRQRVFWSVTVWGNNRKSAKSEAAWFEMGDIANPGKVFQPRVFARAEGIVEITLDGNDPGRVFEGIGAVSAGASTDLLYDYKDPVRGQILDYLFKPKFGAAFQHLKVEMGGGENSTCGSEPSHAITREELKNPVSRGYEFWLMREAKDRNPAVILEYLPWSFPGWLKPDIYTRDSADYFVAFLDVAKKQWALDIDWVAAAENENDTDLNWLVNHMRPALDAKGYSHVRIQGPDDNSGDWKIFDDLEANPAYDRVVEAVGYHYVTGRNFTEDMVDGRGRPTTEKAKASGKPLWASEDWSWTGKDWGGAGALTLARLYNKFYIRDQITKTLIWAPIGSITPGAIWDQAGAMKANRPWSGHYEVWPTIWATAHTTQFAEPHSWRYLDGACGLFNQATYKGSAVALRERNGSNWSLIVCTHQAETVRINIRGGLSSQSVAVWKSDELNQFIHLETIVPADGGFSLKMDANSIYSLTTTTGQLKGRYDIPADAPFPFPYVENYEDRKVGDLPKFHSDQKGSFEIARKADGTHCLKQICPEEGYEWMRIYRRSFIKPHTLIGDPGWSDYTCRVDVFIESGQVEIGGRIRGPFLNGPRLMLAQDGKWELMHGETTLASGMLTDFDRNRWHKLQLDFLGSEIVASINGQTIAKATRPITRGYVALASSYSPNLFDDLEVIPSRPEAPGRPAVSPPQRESAPTSPPTSF